MGCRAVESAVCSYCLLRGGRLEADAGDDIRCEGNETGEAGPLDQVEAVVEGLGFDEVDEETPGEIGGEEETEGGAFGMGPRVVAVEDDGERDEKEDLVELGGMAGDAVAEVYGPGQRGGGAVGVVGEAGEEAADAAYGDADAEGDGEEVAGGGGDGAG